MSKKKNIVSAAKPIMTLKEIGEEIRKARKEKGLTQKELASELKVNKNSISSIERGDGRAGLIFMRKVLSYLDITVPLTLPFKGDQDLFRDSKN